MRGIRDQSSLTSVLWIFGPCGLEFYGNLNEWGLDTEVKPLIPRLKRNGPKIANHHSASDVYARESGLVRKEIPAAESIILRDSAPAGMQKVLIHLGSFKDIGRLQGGQ